MYMRVCSLSVSLRQLFVYRSNMLLTGGAYAHREVFVKSPDHQLAFPDLCKNHIADFFIVFLTINSNWILA
jgi:hypothetical protein